MDLERENAQLVRFERELKRVRYDNDIEDGVQRMEVSNTETYQLSQDLKDID